MLKIRLKPLGSKKKNFYNIVVVKALSKKTAKSIKNLGFYDPHNKILNINSLSLQEYMNYGAYPTSVVAKLLAKYVNLK